jgi:hypothetical protein
MAKKTKTSTAGKIDAVVHKDKRKNIPTEELRDFVRDDENAPKKILYPRDPDLDPQLVWKGKDEQDAAPLDFPRPGDLHRPQAGLRRLRHPEVLPLGVQGVRSMPGQSRMA